MDDSLGSLRDLDVDQGWWCTFEGSKGSLKMTPEELRFKGNTWKLCEIKSHIISAVTATIVLELFGSSSSVGFEMESLSELVRFRKAYVLQMRRLEQINNTPSSERRECAKTQQKEAQTTSLSSTRSGSSRSLSPKRPSTERKGRSTSSTSSTSPNGRRSVTPKRDSSQRNIQGRKSLSPSQPRRQRSEKSLSPKKGSDNSEKARTFRRNISISPEMVEANHSLPAAESDEDTNCSSIVQPTSEELRDDAVAREILELTSGCHRPNLLVQAPQHGCSTSVQSAPEPPTISENDKYKEKTLKSKSSGSKSYTPSGTAFEDNGKRRVASSTSLLAGSSKSILEYVPDTTASREMKTATASVEGESNNVISSARGPGAYRRVPGRQSLRADHLSYSLVTGGVEVSEHNSTMEMNNSERSDEGARRQLAQQRQSLKSLVNTSSNLVTASLVEEPPEVVMPQAVEVDKMSERKTLILGCFCCCFLMIIVAVVVGVSTSLVMSSETSDNDFSLHIVTDVDRLEAFEELTEKLSPTDQSSRGPYNKACEWIVEVDPLKLDPTDETQHDKVLQRFVLALFYFQTTEKGGMWKNCNPPETGESNSCRFELLESYGVEGVYFDQYMMENSFRWLTAPDECQWAGVICEDGIHVSSIHLGGYGLSGSFPAELGHLPHLRVLDLQQNKLESTLPPNFGLEALIDAQRQLQVLRLDQNKLIGTIPDEWCGLSKFALEELNLGGNELTGSLPTCLGELLELKDFSVMGNQLTGTIPPELSGSSKLERFHFAHNDFVGSVPDSICEVESLVELSADCLLNNFLECSCCTKCCDPIRDDCELTDLNMTDFWNK